MTRFFAAAPSIVFTLLVAIAVPTHHSYAADESVIEAVSDYLMFQEYQSGIILPQQIDEAIFHDVLFVDVRDEDSFRDATIPGALHIEWREIMERRDEIADAPKVVLFCNTGALSAQATFAMRLAGYDHVVVLQGGFDSWQKNAGYHP